MKKNPDKMGIKQGNLQFYVMPSVLHETKFQISCQEFPTKSFPDQPTERT